MAHVGYKEVGSAAGSIVVSLKSRAKVIVLSFLTKFFLTIIKLKVQKEK